MNPSYGPVYLAETQTADGVGEGERRWASEEETHDLHDMRKTGLSEERRTTQRESRERNKARTRGGVIVTRGGKRERQKKKKNQRKGVLGGGETERDRSIEDMGYLLFSSF